MKAISKFLDRILTIPVPNPDDARRRRRLNILMLGMFIAAVLGGLAVITDALTVKSLGGAGSQFLLPTSAVFIVGTAILYFINRRSGRWAAFLFLLLITVAFTFSDTPDQLANGRSLFVYTFPIVISSLILFPSASFIFATLSGAILIWLGISVSIFPNLPAIIGFFMLALVSWLSSRGLEQALKDLRSINAELDQRVVERTRQLSEALSRETIEAERREAILNSIADGVIVFDSNGAAILANPSITTLINKPQEKIIGSGFNDLLDSDEVKVEDRGKAAALLEKSAQDLSNFRVEWGKRTISINAANVLDDQHRSIGTVAVLRDFTHEAELERMKNTFLAIVSHELRTPLNAILGYAEMLKELVYGQLNEKQQSVSMRIMTNTQRLLNIVSDLLDQTQIEAGKLKNPGYPLQTNRVAGQSIWCHGKTLIR